MSRLPISEGILFRACATTGFYPKTLRSSTRITSVAQTRQAIMFALRTRTKMSFPQIAKFVGRADHTTAIHAMTAVPERMATNPEYRAFVESLLITDPIKPFSAEAMLVEHGISPAIPERDCGKVWSIPAAPVVIEARHRPDVIRRPAPPITCRKRPRKGKRPTYQLIDCAEHRFLVDEYGRDPFENRATYDMIAGSRGLALSILTARAVA